MYKKRALIITALTGFVRAFLLQDIEILQKLGYEVHCAANGIGDDDTVSKNKEYFNNLGAEFHQIDFSSNNPFSKSTLKTYKQVSSLLKEQYFDLIAVHTPIPGVVVRLAARKYRKKGTKVVYTTHGFYFHKKGSKKQNIIFGNIEKFMSRFSDAIVTINNEDYTAAKKMHSPLVYHINGVGVDTKKYILDEFDRTAYREKLGVSKNQTVLLSVGEISYRKNYQVVIKALSKLKEHNLVYLICGKGLTGDGITKELQQLARNLNVNVIFLGYRRDIPEIIASSDIGVIPSNREGLGLAGIEMLAGGLPVVGSSVQGIKDYVVPEKTGYLADPYDEDDFAKAISKLIDPSAREKMKNTCIQEAKLFDKQTSYKQLTDIYSEVDKMTEV